MAGSVVLPIDVNKNGQADADEVYDTKAKAMQGVATGKYPSPPARALNVVTKSKPSGSVAGLHLVDADRRPEVCRRAPVTFRCRKTR